MTFFQEWPSRVTILELTCDTDGPTVRVPRGECATREAAEAWRRAQADPSLWEIVPRD